MLNNWSTDPAAFLPLKILSLDAAVQFKIVLMTVTASSVQSLWAHIRHMKQKYKAIQALHVAAGILAVYSLTAASMLASTLYTREVLQI